MPGLTLVMSYVLQTKCHQYWPHPPEVKDYGHLSVKCHSEECNLAYVTRQFTLRHKKVNLMTEPGWAAALPAEGFYTSWFVQVEYFKACLPVGKLCFSVYRSNYKLKIFWQIINEVPALSESNLDELFFICFSFLWGFFVWISMKQFSAAALVAHLPSCPCTFSLGMLQRRVACSLHMSRNRAGCGLRPLLARCHFRVGVFCLCVVSVFA